SPRAGDWTDTTAPVSAQAAIGVSLFALAGVAGAESRQASKLICKNLARHEDQADGRESQTKVLGMGLRRPGADSRTAKAHGRADGQAIWARTTRTYAGAQGKRG